jgi:hypothetical protein
MLRFGILAAVIPLALVGGVAYDWTEASARQCASLTGPAARSVAFTDDPSLATVKVQIIDTAELADLAIADEGDATAARGCGIHQLAQHLTTHAAPAAGAPVVHLSRDGDADYRIYVQSATISAQHAAAIIVSARGGHTRLAAQPFDLAPTGSISR